MGKKKKQEKSKKKKEKGEKLLKQDRAKKTAAPAPKQDAGGTAKPDEARRKAEDARAGRRRSAGVQTEDTRAAGRFRALADENRLQILALLADGEQCAGDLLKSLSIVQSTLSHHMKILVDAGIVKCRKQGKWSFYSIDRKAFEETVGYMQKWS